MTKLALLKSTALVLGRTERAAGPWQTSTLSSTARGYGWQWQKTRKRILARDRGLCQPCFKIDLLTPGGEVDHIVNKARGGTDDDANLQTICSTCHKAKTAAEVRGLTWDGPARTG